MTSLRAAGATDLGRVRRTNQDQLLITEGVYAVADGMGGHVGGEVASLTAIEALRAAFGATDGGARTAEDLRAAIRQANSAVFERAQAGTDLRGMGTTMTAAALVVEDGEERLAIANVGDSRAYVFAQGDLTQLSEDHSVPEELVRQGQLDPGEVATHPQRHILTRVLGVFPEVEVDLWEVLPFAGDRVVLCSDGLCRDLSDDQIASVLRRLADPDEAARDLVHRARESGGADNITVVVIDVVDDDNRSAAASAALGEQRPSPRADMPSAPPPASAPSAGSAPAPTVPTDSAVDAVEATRVAFLEADAGRRGRRLTLRVLLFVLVLLALLSAAGVAITFYGRGSYYVGLHGSNPQEIIIYKGRPGGLLWLKPTEAVVTPYSTANVLPSRIPDLAAGKIEPTLTEARAYVIRLIEEAQGATAGPVQPSGPTTIPALPPPPAGATTR